MKIIKNLLNYEVPIRTEQNFPKVGIEFIDITPILADSAIYKDIIHHFVQQLKEKKIDYIISPEARGFWFGCPVAYELGCGYIPVRKPNKLPPSSVAIDVVYTKEYGKDILCIPSLLKEEFAGKNIYIIDDIYATGNTAKAIQSSLVTLGANIVGTAVFINIVELNEDTDVYSIIDINEN